MEFPQASPSWQSLRKVVFGSLFLITPQFVFPSPPAQPPRLNIIFILADDLGPDDVGIYGAFDYEAVPLPPGEDPSTWTDSWGRQARESLTPRLDQLARQGLRFKTAHATGICSPSRIQYLTGQYPWRNGTIDIDGSRYFNDPNGPNHIHTPPFFRHPADRRKVRQSHLLESGHLNLRRCPPLNSSAPCFLIGISCGFGPNE